MLKISSKLTNDADENYLADIISRVIMNLKRLNNCKIAQKSVNLRNEEKTNRNYFADIF